MSKTTADRSAPLVFALPDSESIAERLATALRAENGTLELREFPDGETYVRLDSTPAGREVVLVASLRDPNEKLLPIVFVADAARELGATRVGLVAPYLAYMRQDARFHDGEAVTSRSFASLLSAHVDWLVTVDPHLHRVPSLDGVYAIPSTTVHAADALGDWIARHVARPFVIGPDAESRQWAEGIAAAAGASFAVLTKVRRGDERVIESVPRVEEHRESTPVLVDDIISTGQTMIAAIRHLRDQGSAAPVCVAVHAVFANAAYAELRAAGAAEIVTTNTILHLSNAIDVTPAIVSAVRAQLGR